MSYNNSGTAHLEQERLPAARADFEQALLRRRLLAAVRDFLDKLPTHDGLRVEVEAFGPDEVRLEPTGKVCCFG